MRLEIGHLPLLIKKGGQMPNNSESLSGGILDPLQYPFLGFRCDMIIYAGFVYTFAVNQLGYRYTKVCSRYISKRDVDGAQRSHDDRTAKVPAPVHVLLMVLYLRRVFP